HASPAEVLATCPARDPRRQQVNGALSAVADHLSRPEPHARPAALAGRCRRAGRSGPTTTAAVDVTHPWGAPPTPATGAIPLRGEAHLRRAMPGRARDRSTLRPPVAAAQSTAAGAWRPGWRARDSPWTMC